MQGVGGRGAETSSASTASVAGPTTALAGHSAPVIGPLCITGSGEEATSDEQFTPNGIQQFRPFDMLSPAIVTTRPIGGA